MSATTDAELMRLVADGDAAAFEELYRRHADAVIRTATRRCNDPHEVADVLADTFLAIWRGAGSYDPAKGSASQWIAGIAARRYSDLRRSERRRRLLRERVTGRADITIADLDELVDQIDAERAADAAGLAIGRLPERQRLVFELVALDGLSVTAVADALGMSPSAVSMRLTRARRALRLDPALDAHLDPTLDRTSLTTPGADV
jgi:RNA polymerase sigma-70 factor (ECF subfamily)